MFPCGNWVAHTCSQISKHFQHFLKKKILHTIHEWETFLTTHYPNYHLEMILFLVMIISISFSHTSTFLHLPHPPSHSICLKWWKKSLWKRTWCCFALSLVIVFFFFAWWYSEMATTLHSIIWLAHCYAMSIKVSTVLRETSLFIKFTMLVIQLDVHRSWMNTVAQLFSRLFLTLVYFCTGSLRWYQWCVRNMNINIM